MEYGILYKRREEFCEMIFHYDSNLVLDFLSSEETAMFGRGESHRGFIKVFLEWTSYFSTHKFSRRRRKKMILMFERILNSIRKKDILPFNTKVVQKRLQNALQFNKNENQNESTLKQTLLNQ